MTRAVIAVADQVIVQELRSRLEQSDAEVEVAFVAESTQEMVSAVLSQRPSIVFVHDQLGPGPVMQLVRDLTLRNPALAVLVVTTRDGADSYSAALDAGARGVLTSPFGLEDLNHRLASLLEWNTTVRRVLADNQAAAQGTASRGARVIAVAGAKGGVGATVLASHLAWDAATTERRMRVCLVDLDVENGDVPSYLDVSHRVSIADLAKISDDLTGRAVADTVVVHTSGLHLLLAPTEIRETEFITPEAVRRILTQLRALYHLVLVDVGSAITTTQAAAVESADVTLQVVTADVPALRAARRQVVAWESLGVTSSDAVKVVVNRFVRRSEIQQDTIDALTLGTRSQVLIPDLERGLERAGNSRTPSEVKNQTWWKSLRAIGEELDVHVSFRLALASNGGPDQERTPAAAAAPASPGAQPESESVKAVAVAAPGRGPRRLKEAGQATLETAALFPVALVLFLLCVEMIVFGVSLAYADIAAGDAARAVSLGQDPQLAVAEALPPAFRAKSSVAADGSSVGVTVTSKLLVGDGVAREVPIPVNHVVVKEPR
ncbi:CpaE family protein [uncultured Friedmanniella sp.]|uniref:AAA family ATPase n=1 Tax=uncultured Friedmanniella sp. TaxID=335381 RepID=UPI0035CC311C